ncbi:glycoside hydrolase family 17 protein [Zopfia rhizophila CBS 207.26]|uniref:Probable beta-glucosidase btgE n=1 Tax=Zopfia rhizophila CBS 207.26 TaxID=1314779 RepID=A0A6A6EAR2_9PEZI|nr:glycoside hydrolase family 17 protein [Zopfia rhizophila CBS 207.26]
MKASIIAASAVVGSSVAAYNAHAGFHVRRNTAGYLLPTGVEYQEVCQTYITTFYGEPTLVPNPPPAAENSTAIVYPSPIPTPEKPKPSVEVPTKVPEVPAPAPTKEAYPPPVYSAPPVYTPSAAPSKPVEAPSKPAEKPKPSKPSTPSYGGGNGRIVTNGNKWSITYTPYTTGGECKGADEVKSDIAKIADMGFTTIRSYSTDCGVFENVVPACKEHGLKVILGIFLESGGKGGKGPFSDYANNQLEEIKTNAPKDSIAMIIVGNEAIFNGYCTAEELGSYIDYVRETLHGAGFPEDIAITTTEPVDVWENKGSPLCSHIDIFACQVHPFFTSKISADQAGDFAAEQLEKAAAVCPEVAKKGKYITEIGWPKSGEANGNAVPGYAEQKIAIKSIVEKVGKEACLFSFQDDKWKNPGAFGVEQSFGCAEVI